MRHLTLALLMSIGATVAAPVTSFASGSGIGRPRGIAVLDTSTGKTRWRELPANDRFLSHPGIGQDLVVVVDTECGTMQQTPQNRLIALDARTGKRRWSATGSGAAAKTMYWSPTKNVDVAARGVVVVGGGRYGSEPVGLDRALR